MNTSIILRVRVAVALGLSLVSVVGCSVISHTSAPTPSASEAYCDHAYFKHRGKDYQLRIRIEQTEGLLGASKDGVKFHPIATVLVSQYNPDTRKYDIPVSNEEPVTTEFSATTTAKNQLFVSGGSGVGVGRLSGIPGKRLRIELRLYGVSGMGAKQVVTLNARASLMDDHGQTIYAMAETDVRWVITRDPAAEKGIAIVRFP